MISFAAYLLPNEKLRPFSQFKWFSTRFHSLHSLMCVGGGKTKTPPIGGVKYLTFQEFYGGGGRN